MIHYHPSFYISSFHVLNFEFTKYHDPFSESPCKRHFFQKRFKGINLGNEVFLMGKDVIFYLLQGKNHDNTCSLNSISIELISYKVITNIIDGTFLSL